MLLILWPGQLGAAAVRVDQRVPGPRLMAAQRGDESTISVKRAGRKRAASRSRLMIEDHVMTPPVSQTASGAQNPITFGTRKMGGNLGSFGARETAHYAISHSAGVRFRTNCAIPEGQPADLHHHVPACATRVAQRISLGMPRHAAGRKRRQPAARQRTAAGSGARVAARLLVLAGRRTFVNFVSVVARVRRAATSPLGVFRQAA